MLSTDLEAVAVAAAAAVVVVVVVAVSLMYILASRRLYTINIHGLTNTCLCLCIKLW